MMFLMMAGVFVGESNYSYFKIEILEWDFRLSVGYIAVFLFLSGFIPTINEIVISFKEITNVHNRKN